MVWCGVLGDMAEGVGRLPGLCLFRLLINEEYFNMFLKAYANGFLAQYFYYYISHCNKQRWTFCNGQRWTFFDCQNGQRWTFYQPSFVMGKDESFCYSTFLFVTPFQFHRKTLILGLLQQEENSQQPHDLFLLNFGTKCVVNCWHPCWSSRVCMQSVMSPGSEVRIVNAEYYHAVESCHSAVSTARLFYFFSSSRRLLSVAVMESFQNVLS